jgi:hypothetical protein
LAAVLGLALV